MELPAASGDDADSEPGPAPPSAADSSFVRDELLSAGHLAKKHVHPRLAKMLELAGMNTVFDRASGAWPPEASGWCCSKRARWFARTR
ncbi:MAG: hypothetical protein L6Q84_26735 [Polyangiaceae bacterium]|nr:hypothetical protein [Polyangiaceae bacterium]